MSSQTKSTTTEIFQASSATELKEVHNDVGTFIVMSWLVQTASDVTRHEISFSEHKEDPLTPYITIIRHQELVD